MMPVTIGMPHQNQNDILKFLRFHGGLRVSPGSSKLEDILYTNGCIYVYIYIYILRYTLMHIHIYIYIMYIHTIHIDIITG